jgi:hypothetical protein
VQGQAERNRRSVSSLVNRDLSTYETKPQSSAAVGPDALATATAVGDDLERRLHALDPAVTASRRPLTAPALERWGALADLWADLDGAMRAALG